MALISDSEVPHIPFQEIEIATKNFTTLIGKGGFGNVYKGELSLVDKHTIVAIKRLDANISGQGFKEFLTEIHLLSRYKHPNLISLLGFCQEANEKIIVYEHAENGSFDKFICKDTPLTSKQKINICIDTASGLEYLHNHVAENQRVIHRDIKSANILLDHNWKAMISDLGLSKVGRANEKDTFLITNACGTYGYCDPLYIETGVLTKECDVYSFGVILFEVLCNKVCYIEVNNERRYLAPLAKRYYEEGKIHEIIDPVMKEELHSDSLNKISEIAYQCLLNDRGRRPSMGLVVKKLKQALEAQEIGRPAPMDNEDVNRMPHPILSGSIKSRIRKKAQEVMQKEDPDTFYDIDDYLYDDSDDDSATTFPIIERKSEGKSGLHITPKRASDEATSQIKEVEKEKRRQLVEETVDAEICLVVQEVEKEKRRQLVEETVEAQNKARKGSGLPRVSYMERIKIEIAKGLEMLRMKVERHQEAINQKIDGAQRN